MLSGHWWWTAVGAFALAAALAEAPLASAEPAGRARLHRHPLRVEVAPAGRLYRQCLDHPVIEHRPSGDTVVPWFSCRWAARQ